MSGQSKRYSFRAKVYSVGVNRCVDIPPEVSRALGGGTHIPVKAEIEGTQLTSNLAPRGEGKHRLFVPARIWKALGKDRGDRITVQIERAESVAEVRIPADIAASLARDDEIQAAFDSLTPAQRKHFVRYIEETRSKTALEKRIEQGKERILEHYRKKKRI